MSGAEREIGIEIDFGFPSTGDMQADIEKLAAMRSTSERAVADNEDGIAKQLVEQKELRALAENPVSDDGITYNAEACAAGADRCDKHIRMFEALIEKEQAKVRQLNYMISEIEKHIQMQEKGIQLHEIER